MCVKYILITALFSTLLQGSAGYTPVSQGCDQRSCYPATGNLLIGREEKISSTDSCGQNGKSRYCIISSLDPHTLGGGYADRRDKCYWCDASNPEESHEVRSIVHRWEPPEASSRAEQKMTWWQASNGQENVTLQLDLEAEFHVTHIIITFKTFRPAAMYVEKSFDWGKSWKIHRYFSANCDKDFPEIHKGVPRHLEETVCQERYSRISPSTKGEVIYRVLPPSINIHSPGFNPYSKEVQDLLKTTNLRVTFTRLHKLGDESLDMNPVDIKEKYYYSIYDMIVRGSCSCYGHADRCLPEKPEHQDIPGMVHGTCECSHFTKGNNCELCMDFYHDMPWRPATGRQKNACKRCNCNEHSDKCHFDEAVWEATGLTSGGVCEECQHNTEGRQCESCISGFYQNPEVSLADPDVCLECDCEPEGTVDGGICDGRTDPVEGTVAGQCHCKTYAGGPRCDNCLNGYWNFTSENPDACQECTCNTLGTVSLDGCHQETGECKCKRNVIGRDCDQCRPEHFGLSNDVNGCKPCDCDVGGSFDNNCDVMTGQCACRPNIKGRRCDRVEDFYYTGPLDYLLFEGELAHGSDSPTKITRKKPSEIEGETTWTGLGYMLVFEGSTLTFDVPEIHRTLNYNPVIRYSHLPTHPDTWESVNVELVRIDGPADPSGDCSQAENGPIPVSLPKGNISQELPAPFCLESGQRYQIKMTFSQYDPAQPSQANIYIDSIALLPEIDDIPFLNPSWEDPVLKREKICKSREMKRMELQDRLDGSGNELDPMEDATMLINEAGLITDEDCNIDPESIDRMSIGWSPGPDRAAEMREIFDRLNCRERFLNAKPSRLEPMPKDCEEILYSISFFAFEGAFSRPCECSGTGSLSKRCDTYYGGCECKTQVVGQRCESCAPGSYGFSSMGCQRCECHYQGSQDEFCNQETGQCNCRNNAYGRQCDRCKTGFWNFPNCQQCQCNGHAFACDPFTGECNDCKDYTTGSFCERCKIGYFGDPVLGEDQVPCRACPCPDVKTTEHSYAESCYLEKSTGQPICDCNPGYGGERCDICSDNFFGNPEIPGGECRSCDCSGNWQESQPGNCDPHSGECKKCLYFTEGFNCEKCMPGYFGDAVQGMCNLCTCDMLGTDPDRFDCDRITGECHCLPNVEGENCDSCIENHWRIASGEGCEACDCDPVGSVGPSCDSYVGQCDCRPGFGGRKCDQCEENFWGNPKIECIPCNCNTLGVDPDRTQCDHSTGECFCLEGISGKNCDMCARGYMQYNPLTQDHPVMTRNIPSGSLPDCQKCGECFDNWDRILTGLKDKTEMKVMEAEQVKVTGAAGAYTRSFESMESSIEDVKKIIASASISVEELAEYQRNIGDITNSLKGTTSRMTNLDNSLSDTKQSILQGQYNLTTLRQEADRLQQSAADVRVQATKLQEANVRGALVLTQQAKMRSDQAVDKVNRIAREVQNSHLSESIQQRDATERLIDDVSDTIEEKQVNNTNSLADITNNILVLQNKLPGLNKVVCDGETRPDSLCDDLCGGAGCGKCGGLSCQQGALTKAKEALQNAKEAEQIFAEKDLAAESVLNQVSSIYGEVARAEDLAQVSYDMASEAKNRSLSELNQVNMLSNKIDSFFKSEKATPEQVQGVAYECLNATMTMDTSQVQNLAEEINKAIESVTDVDKINAETAGPLIQAEDLKRQADKAKIEASAELETAENVVKSLSDSEDAQNVAETAIASAQRDIATARRDLGQIETEMEVATSLSSETFSRTESLLKEQKGLQTIYIANENHVKSAQAAAEMAMNKANKANSNLYKLNTDFFDVSSSLAEKSGKIGSAKDRALDLQKRANNLANSASSKLANLQDMEKEYEENQRQLDTLSSQLTELNCKMQIHLMVIQEKSNFYRTCSSPSVWEPTQHCLCPTGNLDPVCTDNSSPARY